MQSSQLIILCPWPPTVKTTIFFSCLISPAALVSPGMRTVNNISEEGGVEPEGSATTEAFMNTSFQNATNITYLSYYQHTLPVAASYILSYSFIFLLCMVGNILVCVTILENRRMRTVNNLFILNLAISDLLVGIFCIPTTLVDNLISGRCPNAKDPQVYGCF